MFAALAALVVATAGLMALRFTLAPGHHEFVRLVGARDVAARYLAAQRLAYRGAMLIHVILGLRLLRGYSVRVRSRPALWARMRAMAWVLDFMLLYAVYECLTILVAQAPDLGTYLNRLRAYLMVLVLVAPSAGPRPAG